MIVQDIPNLIAQELRVRPAQVEATIRLLDDGNTIPFIARYRKEVTGELDEEALRTIVDRLQYLRNLAKRQEDILASIEEQGKLTEELSAAISATTKLQELEDLYLPYRPKKRTRAQAAREKGLEPLSELFLAQAPSVNGDILSLAAEYINTELGVETAEDALAGARDIIAELVAERADIRAQLRRMIWQQGEIATTLAVDEESGKAFLTYREYSEPVRRIPSHRILAVNRGESKDVLKVQLVVPQEQLLQFIHSKVVTGASLFQEQLTLAIADGYKRLLFPALEREIRGQLTENAEKQAIRVFGLNLRQLLLQQPLGGHTVLGLDPGFRTGCKAAVVNANGTVLATTTLFITLGAGQKAKGAVELLELLRKHNVTLVAIGNGTASYETEEFLAELIREHNLNLHYLITNEAGASVYSASKLAKDELPGLDVSLRGAVSIARRVQDPLAELVKIDPKSIGVGQYQHDVNQKELAGTLDSVVDSAVNHVGIDLNTASVELLKHVSGINATVAKNIVSFRDENGSFDSRKKLLKVPRLGQAAFTQCAGFLRIVAAKNPLDNTPVHPESYPLAESILSELGFAPTALADKQQLPAVQDAVAKSDAKSLAAALNAGEPTVRDILSAFAKPGRDPREDLPAPLTRKNLVTLAELTPGSVVRGTVHNVIDFGVFVDIGIKTNGLIHRSELSHKMFRHPLDIVSVGDILDVMILSVDEARGRIALSLKQVPAQKA
ncbi:Tex family protein [Azotosporobacter soli]|uniref:Tex family protein n=1 Tax=Azotosporobacter soli TaxID=3055040 RepID=UPI0031FE8B49